MGGKLTEVGLSMLDNGGWFWSSCASLLFLALVILYYFFTRFVFGKFEIKHKSKPPDSEEKAFLVDKIEEKAEAVDLLNDLRDEVYKIKSKKHTSKYYKPKD